MLEKVTNLHSRQRGEIRREDARFHVAQPPGPLTARTGPILRVLAWVVPVGDLRRLNRACGRVLRRNRPQSASNLVTPRAWITPRARPQPPEPWSVITWLRSCGVAFRRVCMVRVDDLHRITQPFGCFLQRRWSWAFSRELAKAANAHVIEKRDERSLAMVSRGSARTGEFLARALGA